jgi:alpha-glucosidase
VDSGHGLSKERPQSAMKTSRPFTLMLGLFMLAVCPPRLMAAERVEVKSPDGTIQLELSLADGRVVFSVHRDRRPVIEQSPFGLVVDGVDLSQGTELGAVERYQFDDRYATRGVHSLAVNRGHGVRIPAQHKASGTRYTVEARAFDDGIALRILVPADKRDRVVDEATVFRLVPGSTVWYHNLRGHYEGVYARKRADEIQAGEWAAPPLTIKLPGGAGYASITESMLGGFAGMALQSVGGLGFAARLGHAHPASYPFTLRYKEDVERLARPAGLTGAITSPWRVVMVGSDLNTLVNCDIVNNLAPPPDPALFPQGLATPWIKPGRAVWKFLDGGASTFDGMKEFSKLAGELGFEYNVIEGFWQRWTDAQLRELVEASRAQGVGLWLWKHSKELRSPEARRAFFERCAKAGAVGAKIDFFDHEAKEVVDLYPILLRDAAEHRLMVDFHGSNKPTGESRTWPNELGREGVYGLEHKGMTEWSRHNATVPFTRLLAGHADYTPVLFGDRRRETSWAHQIATAAVMTSPLLVYAAHPRSLLNNPAVEMIKSIPSVWDETVVLPSSEIGERAAFARRHGDRWFLTVVNGPVAETLHVPASFLGAGKYQALLVRDREDNPAAVKIEEATVTPNETLEIHLRAGGGFIARFTKL